MALTEEQVRTIRAGLARAEESGHRSGSTTQPVDRDRIARDRALALITDGDVSASDLLRALRIPASDLNDLLESLESEGLVRIERIATKGRPRLVIHSPVK